VAALLVSASALVGCSGGETGTEQADAGHVAEYTVRGRVEQIPSPDSPASEFQVHHEPIPSFRASWPDGELGMNSMIMPFPLGEGVSLDQIEVGDVVELTFAVEYSAESGSVQTYRVVAVAELPADTELQFGRVDADAGEETNENPGG